MYVTFCLRCEMSAFIVACTLLVHSTHNIGVCTHIEIEL